MTSHTRNRKKKTIDLHTALLQALRAKYPNDYSHPGVVTSFLGERFYASIRRYWQAGHVVGEVIAKAHGATLAEAIKAVAQLWFEKNTPLSVPDTMAVLKAALR